MQKKQKSGYIYIYIVCLYIYIYIHTFICIYTDFQVYTENLKTDYRYTHTYIYICIYYVYINQVHIFWQQMEIYPTWKHIQKWVTQPKCHDGFLMVWPHQLDFKCMETFSGCFFMEFERNTLKYMQCMFFWVPWLKGGFTPGRPFYHCSCLKTQAWLLGVKALDKRASPL